MFFLLDWTSPRARVRNAAVLGALAAVGAGALWPLRGRGNGTSVLLVTVDAVRPDRLGAYGGPVPTPHLDAIAKEGVRFSLAYTTAPLCLPAHASILTGLWPSRHGLRDESQDLPKGVTTAAEVFRRAGYLTAAAVGSTMLDRSRGFDRGFDAYLDDLGAPGKRPGRGERDPADTVVDRALAWLAAAPKDEPVFLWVHLSDAKAPYAPAGDLSAAYKDRPYDGELAGLDRAIGRLTGKVRAARPRLALAVVADHADAQGEHGEDGYGFFVYGSTTRVPLLLAVPDAPARGKVVAAVVRVIDLLPTLLDYCGLRGPRADGRSLRRLAEGRSQDAPGPALVENVDLRRSYGLAPLFAVREGEHFYVRAPRPELYVVSQDGLEKDDASARLPQVARALDQRIGPQDTGAPGATGAAPDPKDFLDVYRRFRAAETLDDTGDRAKAVMVYRSILSEVPAFAAARTSAADALMRDEQFQDGALALQEVVTRGEATPSTYLNLALAMHRTRRTEEALVWLRKGVDAFPASAALRHRTGRVLLLLKRADEAEKELAEAVRLEPLFLDARLAQGLAEEMRGKPEAARAAFEEVRRLAPDSAEAREAATSLGRLGAGPEASPSS
ncbi:MAG: sulfatase-like hydrolase/transferase [Vicinamibacteria bacterium]